MANKQSLKAGEKVLFAIFGIFMVVATIMFAVLEVVRANSDHTMFPNRTHYELSGVGKEGHSIYQKANCNACHRVMRMGTSMGLVLDGIGSYRSYDWLLSFLTEPEKTYARTFEKATGRPATTLDHGFNKEAGKMIQKIPRRDLEAIARFLSELKVDAGSSMAKAPPPGESPFIDNMLKYFAPPEWEEKGFKDVRDKGKSVGNKETVVTVEDEKR